MAVTESRENGVKVMPRLSGSFVKMLFEGYTKYNLKTSRGNGVKVMPRLSGSSVMMLFEGYNKVYLKNQNGVSVFTGPLQLCSAT
ncbi:MAG: hypothetical protein B5M56_10670 [Desulfococcus sp. 4484_241]|nr:MAG: hypothetical protein B5M56_10670 [Desulfococcus sp. 4484_241]